MGQSYSGMPGEHRARERVVASLIAPGAEFEITERAVRDIPMRVYTGGPQTLREVFQATEEYGDRTFTVFQGERVTFAEHAALVRGLATALRDEYGVAKGDRVGIAMRNYPEWPAVFFAAQAIGATVVPFNAWWSADELRYAALDSTPRLIVADAERTKLLAPVCAEVGDMTLIEVRAHDEPTANVRQWHDLVAALDLNAELPDVLVDPEDDSTILYTSGTTGRPKGAIGSHRNHCTNLRNTRLAAAVALAGQPVPAADAPQPGTLCPFPMFHIAGLSTMINAAASGSKLALLYKWDVSAARQLIRAEKLTGVAGVPTLVKELVEDQNGDPSDLQSLVSVASGGAAIPPDLIARIESQFNRTVSPTNGYGLTETTSAIVFNSGEDYFAHPDSVGRLQPGADLRIVGSDGQDVAPGATGELCFRGPNVVRGYWNRPEATAEAFEQGWFRTGDLGRYEDGFVYVVDRLKDVIIRGGENIYCVEVEGALFEHPAVLDVALIGVPDEHYGEAAIAAVELRPGATATEAQLQQHVAERLAAFKVPARVVFRDEALPRTATGKALKRQLRQEYVERNVSES